MKVEKELDCRQCEVYGRSVFCKVDDTNPLNPEKTHVSFRQGENLFREGDMSKGVFCLRKGRMLILKKGEAGQNRILAVAEAGEILGVSSIMSGGKYSTTAMALSAGHACLISTKEFKALSEKYPRLTVNTMKMLSMKLNKLDEIFTE